MNTKRLAVYLFLTGLCLLVNQSCTEVTDFDNDDVHKYPWLSKLLIDYHDQPIQGKHNLDLGTIEFEYSIGSISKEAFRQHLDSVSAANKWKVIKSEDVMYILQKDIEIVSTKSQTKHITILLLDGNIRVRYLIE